MNLSITLLLIAATVLVSWLSFNNPQLLERLILWPPAIERRKQYDRLLTHGFIHADFQHLLFNMITLYFFGRLVEQVFVPRVGASRLRAVLPVGDRGGDPADLRCSIGTMRTIAASAHRARCRRCCSRSS